MTELFVKQLMALDSPENIRKQVVFWYFQEDQKPVTIFAKNYLLDICQGP